MREDVYTHTEADAGRWEADRGRDYDVDDRPRRGDFGPDDTVDAMTPWQPRTYPVQCRAETHTQPGGDRVTSCAHCPRCGSDVTGVVGFDFFTCTRLGCPWTHGTDPTTPPF